MTRNTPIWPPWPPSGRWCRRCRGCPRSRRPPPPGRRGWRRWPPGPPRPRCSHSRPGCASNTPCPSPPPRRCRPPPSRPTRTDTTRNTPIWPPWPPSGRWCRRCRGCPRSRRPPPRGIQLGRCGQRVVQTPGRGVRRTRRARPRHRVDVARHRRGQPERTRRGARRSGHHGHHLVGGVGDVEVARGVDGHPARGIQLGRCGRARCTNTRPGCASNTPCPSPPPRRCRPPPSRPTRTDTTRSTPIWPPWPPSCWSCRRCRGFPRSRWPPRRERPGWLPWRPGPPRPRCSHSRPGCASNTPCPSPPPCRCNRPSSPARRTCPRTPAPSAPGCWWCRR